MQQASDSYQTAISTDGRLSSATNEPVAPDGPTRTQDSNVSALPAPCSKSYLSLELQLLEPGPAAADRLLGELAGLSALHAAARAGKDSELLHLLTSGAAAGTVDPRGVTPLHVAALAGHSHIVQSLMVHKGGAATAAMTSEGLTALHFAAASGSTAVIQQLTTTARLLHTRVNINAASATGVTPLYLAAAHGHVEAVKQLLSASAAANAAISTPPGSASSTWSSISDQQHGMNAAAVSPAAASHSSSSGSSGSSSSSIPAPGSTPLHIASQNGFCQIVQLLLSAQADVGAVNLEGHTALHLAVFGKHRGVAELLLQAAASPTAADNTGMQ